MKIKRFAALLLAIAMLLGMTACSQNNSGDVLNDDGWDYFNGKGSFSLAVQDGMVRENAPRLMRTQPEEEWMLMASLQHNSALPQGANHVGLALYRDKNNYLVWGPEGNGEITLSGRMGGKDTGVLCTLEEDLYLLRIWKVTRDSETPRYYFYAAKDSYYSWQYGGYFEDTKNAFDGAQYGVMGESETGGSSYCAQFEYIDEFAVYNYKDYFRSKQLDGRWVDCTGNTTSQSGRDGIAMGAESCILRNAWNFDWTIETRLTGTYHKDSGLKVRKKDAELRLLVDGTALKAIVVQNGQSQTLAEEAMGNVEFLRIVQRGNTFLCKVSDDGKAFQDFAEFTDGTGMLTGAQYGLFAEDDAKFKYFWEGVTPDGTVKGVKWFEEKGQITGEDSLNRTQSRWGQGSTDLGTMFELNGAVYMVFGDTFQYSNQGGTWYKNSMAKISNTKDYESGPIFEWVKVNQNNGGLVNVRPNTDTGSMIATSGTGVNRDGQATLFMHIMEIRRWTSYGTHWVTNGSGWASSTDDGNTWKLHERMFEGDTNFAQIACYQKDGFLYMLGAGAAGYGPVKLCRAPLENFELRDNYEFYIGTDETGNPRWSPNEADAVAVIDSVNKEIAVVYNEGMDCFLFTTLDNVTQQMVIRDAKNIWGPWSKPSVLFDESYVTHVDNGQKFFYGSFMYSGFMTDDGRTVYMTLNKWVPYNIQWMKVHFETE